MSHRTLAVGTATRATRVEPSEVGLRRPPRRRSAMGASSMTQQSESTTTTTPREADEPPSTTGFAPPFPPLAEPRPLSERRVWPRTFHD
ncbi:hypothetical protein GRC12_16765, partial [Streptomyces griseorubiginosus]|nr:hypothetical protein [Streptomyces griseorubiginosus]